MKLITVMLASVLAGCSIVQLSPTMNCDYLKYERIQNEVSIDAEGCRV